MKRATLATLAALLLLLAAACSDSGAESGASNSGPPSSEAPGTATIDTFEAPASVDCPPDATSTELTVSYAVSGAERQVVRVDGLPADGTEAASGSVTVGVKCDPLPHDVVVIAYDADGGRTTQIKSFTTNLTQ